MEVSKLYIVSNYGEYADHLDTKAKTCGWSFSELCDSLSKTYQRAYNYMKRVNKSYGYNRCSVVKLEQKDYNAYFWSRMVEEAK